MSMAFRFELQAKLEALRAEQEVCARARQRACDERDGVRRQHDELMQTVAELGERLEQEARSWRSADPLHNASDLERLDQRRVVLQRKGDALRTQAEALRVKLGFLQQVVELRTAELRDIAGRVQAMESLRDVQRKAWEHENQKREQHDVDEASQLAWQARQREEERRDRPAH